MDIEIELLRLSIDDASGQEHRIRPIAARAAEILAERLDNGQERTRGRGGRLISRIHSDPIQMDLNRMSDERAARSIATAWLEALTAKLEAGG